MKTVTDHLREHLYESFGIFEKKPHKIKKDVHEDIIDAFLPAFVLMVNRIVIGEFRYGPFMDSPNTGKGFKPFMDKRMKMYVKDNNSEFCIDLANGAILEYLSNQNNFKSVEWREK